MIVFIMFYQHENIEKDLLDANSSYAMKMSDVMSSYIEMAQGELALALRKLNQRLMLNILKMRLIG